MGCVFSNQAERDANKKRIRKPRPWRHTEPITRRQLKRMRAEFWDTAPHYGGRREVWDALKVASESNLKTAERAIENAGIIVENDDLTVVYDDRGVKYELPRYIFNSPVNMIRGRR